jgi:hypothetical protein
VSLLVGSKLSSLVEACAPLSSNALTPLNVLSLPRCTKVTSGKHVEHVFLLVHGAVHEEESDTSDERYDGDGTVVPDELGVNSQRSKGLSERSRESSGKALHGLNERMFLGALVKAYSSVVTEAKISEMAMRT